VDVAVTAGGVVQVSLGVVTAAQGDLGDEDAAPGRDRDPEGDQEALERAGKSVA
jgi:hypothetical protein